MNDVVDNTEAETQPDELTLLKNQAAKMGIKHHPSIGVDALREKIDAALNDKPAPAPAPAPEAAVVAEDEAPALTPAQERMKRRTEIRAKALKLVRCRISNMDPKKKDLVGEIFTVANKYIGDVKKFIPYGEASDEGYHIPQCIYDNLKSRKFQKIIRKKSDRPGQPDKITTRWVPEFNIEVLPDLTEEELAELAKVQAAKAGVE